MRFKTTLLMLDLKFKSNEEAEVAALTAGTSTQTLIDPQTQILAAATTTAVVTETEIGTDRAILAEGI